MKLYTTDISDLCLFKKVNDQSVTFQLKPLELRHFSQIWVDQIKSTFKF